MKKGIINNGACCEAVGPKDTVVTERPWGEIRHLTPAEARLVHISRYFTKVAIAGAVADTFKQVASVGHTYRKPVNDSDTVR